MIERIIKQLLIKEIVEEKPRVKVLPRDLMTPHSILFARQVALEARRGIKRP